MNDWSARDLQFAEMQGPLGPCKGKDSAITLGPWLVTADELAPARRGISFDLGLAVWVNDVLIGQDRLHHMAWSFPEMLAYASRGTRLEPGGRPRLGYLRGRVPGRTLGTARARRPPALRPGDVVRMAVDGLGEISNRVVAAAGIRQPLELRQSHLPESSQHERSSDDADRAAR